MISLFSKRASSTTVDNKKTVAKKNEKALQKSSGGPSGWSKVLNWLQELGKSLQFPIAVLPFAAILSRFGALGVQFTSTTIDGNLQINNVAGYWISYVIQTPGAVVFSNLPLIFAIGVAFGLAKDHRGEVALVGAVFYIIISTMNLEGGLPKAMYGNVLTFDAGGTAFSKLFYVPVYKDGVVDGAKYVLDIGVLGGIVAGATSAVLYNRFKDIKLPQALSFFGGRRFVPMMAIIVAVPTALVFAVIWPWIQYVLMLFGEQVGDPNKPAIAIPGTMVYGVLNRLLLPFGLHQILNTFFWFQLPIHGQVIQSGSGAVINGGNEIWVNGDINAFTQGVAGAGLFQSGFFPIMMGGVPAIALAMIYAAPKENRKQVAGFLGGVALVSLISGITEPIEYSFVFLSPLLLGIHAALTGIFMGIATAMHIQVGFGFSAGLIDYAISMAQSWGFSMHNTGAYKVTANPLWILLLSGLAGAAYFPIFYFTIKKMDIKTPGREDDYVAPASTTTSDAKTGETAKTTTATTENKYSIMAGKIIEAIGVDNFVSVDNCATRLRLLLKDNSKVDDAKIKASGAFGVKRLGTEAFQIVIGTDVEHVANEVKKQLIAAGSKATLN